MSVPTNRREFLKTAAAAGAGITLGAGRAPAQRKKKASRQKPTSPNEKLNIGIIGAWGRGRANTRGVRGENIVALCDVDSRHLEKVGQQFPKATKYKDWRKLLDQKGIDAVAISCPDHHHALASVAALKRGISVYCEKPVGHSVYEARVVQETYKAEKAKKPKLATQMGTQIHAGENYRRVVELVQGGAIGPVREAHAWCGRRGPGGAWPKGEQPVPAYLDWDLWLGPAPYHPYNGRLMPGNMTWNRYWDFGNGTLGDMGSHVIDLAFWALKLRDPLTCEAQGEPKVPSPHTNPKWLILRWEHPARGDMPPVTLKWYDGIQRPKSPPGLNLSKWGLGVLFVGESGMLLADYGKHVLLPAEKFKDFKRPKPSIPRSLGHYREWVHACKTGATTTCNFDYSGKLIEHNLLGNVAYRVGKKLKWDAENLKAVGCPEADKFIRRKYREGWTI